MGENKIINQKAGTYRKKDIFQKGLFLLDRTYETFQNPNNSIANAFNELLIGLHDIRNDLSRKEWYKYIEKAIEHPIKSILHQDLHTKRSFEKPREYAGDAVLIDYLLNGNHIEKNLKGIGLEIFKCINMCQTSFSLRERPKIIGNTIDQIIKTRKKENIRIISIACGHLREASNSNAILNKRVSDFIALDIDKRNLEMVDSNYGHCNISTIHSDFKGIILKKALYESLGKFDFAYTPGFFDYLTDSAAKKLLKNMFNLLKPGGKLIITNFLPIVESGYMEAFMGWHLIYRDMIDIEKLSHVIPENKIESKRIFSDKYRSIAFLEIDKCSKEKSL